MYRGEKNTMGGMSGHVFPSRIATCLCSAEGFEILATTV